MIRYKQTEMKVILVACLLFGVAHATFGRDGGGEGESGGGGSNLIGTVLGLFRGFRGLINPSSNGGDVDDSTSGQVVDGTGSGVPGASGGYNAGQEAGGGYSYSAPAPAAHQGGYNYDPPAPVAQQGVASQGGYNYDPPPVNPQPSYGPPQHQSAVAPQQNYGPPKQEYGPPKQEYGAPQQQSAVAPQQNYGPPPAPPSNSYLPGGNSGAGVASSSGSSHSESGASGSSSSGSESGGGGGGSSFDIGRIIKYVEQLVTLHANSIQSLST